MHAKPTVSLWLAVIGLLSAGLLGGILWAERIGINDQPVPQSNAEPKPVTVVAAGDISCAPETPTKTLACQSDATAKLIGSINPEAVLALGDIQYQNGELANFQAAYDKTWGVFKDKTYPVPGNHEYQTAGAAGYYDYFGERAHERDKGYYSFKLGDWLLLALNSEIDVSAGSPQYAWLEQELKNSKSACTLAYWHKPRFSTGGHPDDPTYDAFWRLLYEHGADLVLNGHSHAYERYVPQNPDGAADPEKGIVQIVSGMGGANSQKLAVPAAALATRQNHAFGVTKLDLFPKSARYQFVPIPGTQTFTDSGIISCH